jgi:hypothetical protein
MIDPKEQNVAIFVSQLYRRSNQILDKLSNGDFERIDLDIEIREDIFYLIPLA